MNSIKCKNCGLSNFISEAECRRCGNSFLKSTKAKAEKTPSRFSLSSLLFLALLAGLAYFVYSGTQDSVNQVNADEARRIASQPAEQPLGGSSRSEYERKKTGTYGDAVKGSSSLSAHQKHIDETQKTMQQISNNQPTK